MEIRFARRDDIPALEKLLLQVCSVHAVARPDLFCDGGQKYTADELDEIIGDESRPILVYDDGGVVGYAFCVISETDGKGALKKVKSLYIDDLCVDSATRSKGVGTALYEAAIKLAKEKGCYNLTLNVWCGNDSAMEFYRKRGLKPQKIGMETILKQD